MRDVQAFNQPWWDLDQVVAWAETREQGGGRLCRIWKRRTKTAAVHGQDSDVDFGGFDAYREGRS